MAKEIFLKGQLYCNYAGFNSLVRICSELDRCSGDIIHVDMRYVTWFDAHLCASFGAILEKAKQHNQVSVVHVPSKLSNVLCRNSFMVGYGGVKIPDSFDTSIEFRKFNTCDERTFAEYVNDNLNTDSKKMPHMSDALKKKILGSIAEIFSNSVIHSKTKHGIFSCGQTFLNRNSLDFSIADLGIGIRENLLEQLRLSLSPEDAIDWAMSERNTTKQGAIPGGIGLKMIREFINLNRGRLIIVSDSGFWEARSGVITKSLLANKFPGTIVNIEINTSDSNSYCLASELAPNNVL